MARETKVGLLAGLAFIVCFAIILANRGREGWISRYVSPQAGTQASATPGPIASPAAQTPTRHNAEPTPAQDRFAAGGHVPRSVPRRVDRQVSQNRPPSDPATTPIVNQTPQADRQDEEWRQVLEQRIDELTLALNAQKHEGPQEAVTDEVPPFDIPQATTLSARTRRQGPKTYKVMPGDTLSEIAATHYKSRSNTVINAIFDANRSLLASPGEVRSGIELVLPVIEGYGETSPASAEGGGEASPSKPEPAKAKEPKSPPFRWYQIKKNDRYVSIARVELGDESRWREIYELNKEKFPDAGKIRDGVRIKLPLTKVASSQKDTP